MKNYPGNIRD